MEERRAYRRVGGDLEVTDDTVIIGHMVVHRHQWPALWLLVILLLAAGLRFWRLDGLPPGLYHDEAYNGLDALSLLQGKLFPQYYEGWELYAGDAHADRPAVPTRFPVFFEGNYGREPLHVYLMALSIRLFGNTPFAVRAVMAVAGTLAVFTTWLAARALFPPDPRRLMGGELLPLLAAFSLAVLYPALTFSRFGIRAMTLLPPMTLAVYSFWRGWHGRSDVWLGLAGFFTGLSLYTFAAARLFPLAFMLFGLFMLIVDWPSLRQRWRGLALATGAALLTALPLLWYFIRYPYFFVFRMAFVANRGAGVVEGAPARTWLLNVGRVMGGLFRQGDTHLRHNLPGRPYLDPLQALLLAAGAVRGVRYFRKPAYAFVLFWFGVMLLPSILSGDAPHFGRLVGLAPPAAILIAIGGTWLAEKIAAHTRSSWVAPAVLVGLSVASLTLTTRDYFGRYANHPDLPRDFYQADWRLGQYAAAQPPATVLYLSPSQEEMATIYFALADPDGMRSFNGDEGLIPAGIPGQAAVYLVRPAAETTLSNLQSYFPSGEMRPSEDNFVAFHVPADAERIRTAMTADSDFGGIIKLVGYTIDPTDDQLLVTLAWQAVAATSVDYTGFVHLLDAGGDLVAQTDRPPAGYPTSDWRPGEIIIEHFRVRLPSSISPGTYRLRTGFYDPATVIRLGEAADLGPVNLP